MSMSHGQRKVLLIRMNHSYAGFFSYVTFALNQLRYCEAMGFHPVVHFGPRSGDGPNAFHDPRVGDNSWDYFFEPVAGLSWAELRARLADPRDPLTPADVTQLDADFLWYLHAYDPDGIYNYPYGHYKSLTDDRLDAWYARQRASARRLLARYVRPKPHVLAQVDAFWRAQLAGHDVLGVHMRGSDKGAADASTRLSSIVEPDEYFPHIDRFIGETANPRIFLATEQAQFVARTRARYGKRVVARAVTRTDTFGPTSNPFQARTGSGYLKGEEVLVDCLLLARSWRLLRCTSAVGEYAVYFNEGLESFNLNHLSSPIAAPAPARSLARAIVPLLHRTRTPVRGRHPYQPRQSARSPETVARGADASGRRRLRDAPRRRAARQRPFRLFGVASRGRAPGTRQGLAVGADPGGRHPVRGGLRA